VCVCAFSLRRDSSDMILGDKPLISEVVLSQAWSSTPTPAPCLREEPSKKGVQWGPVKTGALGPSSLTSRPPGWLAGGVQSTMKSANIWLLIAWCDAKYSSNSANSDAHLAILPVAFGLWSMALGGYEDTTEIM
jgi:hypothetical protein